MRRKFVRPSTNIRLKIAGVRQWSFGVEPVCRDFIDQCGQIAPTSVDARRVDTCTLGNERNRDVLGSELGNERLDGGTHGGHDERASPA